MKILGLMWDPREDHFAFHVKSFNGAISKRTILSYISRLYDPLGFLAPVVFFMKWFLQQLWLCKVHWDDDLPLELCNTWRTFTEQFDLLSSVKIPRFFGYGQAPMLVGFSDASERGYAAVIYLVTHVNGSLNVSLICAKTKVAPLKPLTISCLELCGGLLLSRFMKSSELRLHKLKVDQLRLFTDSRIVLAWLKLQPRTLTTYVSNRVT